jgi:hypothetical protein
MTQPRRIDAIARSVLHICAHGRRSGHGLRARVAYVGAAVGLNVSPFSAAASTPVRPPPSSLSIPLGYRPSTARVLTGRQRTRPPARNRKRYSPHGDVSVAGASQRKASCGIGFGVVPPPPSDGERMRTSNHQPTSAWRGSARLGSARLGAPMRRLPPEPTGCHVSGWMRRKLQRRTEGIGPCAVPSTTQVATADGRD